MQHRHDSPVLVATYGNAMAGNDAFGTCVAAALLAAPNPNIEVLNAGLRPGAVFDCQMGQSALIVVDAAYSPDTPSGRLMDADWFDPNRPPLLHDLVMSTHGFAIADQIELADRLSMLPPTVRLLAVTVANVPKVGDVMDESVCRRIPDVVQRIHEIALAPAHAATEQPNA